VRNGDEHYICLSACAEWQIVVECATYADRTFYSMPLLSMAEKSAQCVLLQNHAEVLMVEDHLQDYGFAPWLLEARAADTELWIALYVRSS
jgi:hypothetical protein